MKHLHKYKKTISLTSLFTSAEYIPVITSISTQKRGFELLHPVTNNRICASHFYCY
jgi:hypothetical protein